MKSFLAFTLVALGFAMSIFSGLANAKDETKTTDYTTTDIEFEAHDNVEMLGRLVLPKSKSPRAIVIAVQTAEGATVDMKRPLGRGKTFNYYDLYRKQLAEKNIGFFSYEGRGIRMGDDLPRYEEIDWEVYNTSTLDNKVQDVLSAIKTVRKQPGLAETPILLLGASEGTLLAAEAATKQPDSVAGLVLYGVLVKNLRETFRYIMSDGTMVSHLKQMDSDDDKTITREEWDDVVKGKVEFAKADINKDGVFNVDDMKVSTQQYLDAIDQEDYEVLQAWAKTSAAVAVPENWFKDHFEHKDNRHFLLQLDIPIGCFHGELDAMTPVAALKELESKAKDANRDKMEFHFFEGLDHTLNVGNYFVKGKLPVGHQAIFEFIHRVAPTE